VDRLADLRDRLPSLYRPDGDDTDVVVPLAVDELTEIRGDEPLEFALKTSDGALVAERDDPAVVRELRVARAKVPGVGYALELYRLDGHTGLPPRPAIVVDVEDGVARLPVRFHEARFAVQLRRRGLISLFFAAVAEILEELNRDASDVMQSHWFTFADRALYDPFFLRTRELEEKPPAALNDVEVREFPYIDDLGRLAALIPLPPWQEAVLQGRNGSAELGFESVESYRERIARIVDLYRNGLGTVHAIRSMTEAQLPVDILASPERRDRPFSVEEFAPLVAQTLAVRAPAEPLEVLGPLTHWTTTSEGLEPVVPTVYLQGPSEAELAEIDPDGDTLYEQAASPLLELASTRLGIAYTDTVPTGQTLRLRPAYASFIGRDDGVRRADSLPRADAPADPAAPGPWVELDGAPTAAIVAILSTADHTLWVAENDDGEGWLWRFDGTEWTPVLEGQPELHCLVEDGDDLLLGGEGGLIRLPQYPAPETDEPPLEESPEPPSPEPPVAAPHAVYALLRGPDGGWFAGTDIGVARVGAEDALEPFGIGTRPGEQTPVYALATDATGTIYAGGELGLFQYQPTADRWYWYAGASASETDDDWREFHAAEADDAKRGFPTEDDVFLPAVRSIHRGPDASLWLGTDAGFARYVAVSRTGGRTYTTLLEAFPDLGTEPVQSIVEDAAGLVWFCTGRGLMRFDGRDLHQFRSPGAWTQLGRADRLYHDDDAPRDRGAWRFVRSGSGWQRADVAAGVRTFVAFDDVRATEEAAVHALAFADSLAADLLDGFSPDDLSFSAATPLQPTAFVMRRKLDGDRRVVEGGLPAVPRLPPGTATWRYLALEPDDVDEPEYRPTWTIEGRLIPPDDPSEIEEPLPEPGRYFDDETVGVPPFGEFNHEVFAYKPAARIWLTWEAKRPLTVLTRLRKRSPDDNFDPAALDRVWQGIRQVRPAGVRAMLAVDDVIVRRENHVDSR
jgi:hypothetical protein